MSFDVKVYEDEVKKANVDPATGRPVAPWWTFSVDGQPSGKFFPNRNGVDRCVERLRKGYSAEAFGNGLAVFQDGRQVGTAHPRGQPRTVGRAKVTPLPAEGTVTKETKHGGTKVVEARPKFRAELDGEHLGDFDTELEARRHCAFRAFMTRGKLALAGKTVTTPDGTEATVEYDGRSLTATCTAGKRWAVGYDHHEGNHKVKPLPAANARE